MNTAPHSLFRIVPADDKFPGLGVLELVFTCDPAAKLSYVAATDTCYVTGLHRGHTLSGTELLRIFRQGPAAGRRVKVIGATDECAGFYEKMMERGLIEEWTGEDVESFFELEDSGEDEDE